MKLVMKFETKPILALWMGLILLPAFTYAAESEFPPEILGFSLLDVPSGNEGQVEVIDEFTGLPLTAAAISRETLNGEHGAVSVLHVSHPGFHTFTLIGAESAQIRVYLKPLAALVTSAVATGKLTDYKLPFLRNHVEGGLVLRSLGISDLLALNVDSLLSPLKDDIRVLGQTKRVPSNLVFPNQRVPVLLGSITLDKPVFRLPISTKKRLSLVAVEAAIGVTDLLAQMGNLKPVALVNLMKSRKVGFTEKISPEANLVRDVALGHELAPAYRVSFPNPDFPADIFGLSLLDRDGGFQTLIPLDVKAMAAGTYETLPTKSIALSSIATPPLGATKKILVAAVAPEGTRISASVLEASAQAKAAPFLSAPSLDAAVTPTFAVTAPPSGVAIVGWISEDAGVPISAHQVAILPSVGRIEIPTAEWGGLAQLASFSLTRIEFGAGFSERQLDGVEILKSLTRFTYSQAPRQ